MSLRVIICFALVIGFSIYAWKNWFASLCAALVLMAISLKVRRFKAGCDARIGAVAPLTRRRNETCRLFRAARWNILCLGQSVSMLRRRGFCGFVEPVRFR